MRTVFKLPANKYDGTVRLTASVCGRSIPRVAISKSASFRLLCVVQVAASATSCVRLIGCDVGTSRTRRTRPEQGCCTTKKKEKLREVVGWFSQVEYKNQWQDLENTVINLRVTEMREFSSLAENYHLLQKNSASWSELLQNFGTFLCDVTSELLISEVPRLEHRVFVTYFFSLHFAQCNTLFWMTCNVG